MRGRPYIKIMRLLQNPAPDAVDSTTGEREWDIGQPGTARLIPKPLARCGGAAESNLLNSTGHQAQLGDSPASKEAYDHIETRSPLAHRADAVLLSAAAAGTAAARTP